MYQLFISFIKSNLFSSDNVISNVVSPKVFDRVFCIPFNICQLRFSLPSGGLKQILLSDSSALYGNETSVQVERADNILSMLDEGSESEDVYAIRMDEDSGAGNKMFNDNNGTTFFAITTI